MPPNEDRLAAMEKLPPPPAWRMEPFLYNLFELLGSRPEIAIKISLMTLDYDRECAEAKARMYKKINELMIEAKLGS
jgi:hypothetical protein